MFYFLGELKTEEERDRVLRYYLTCGKAMKQTALRYLHNEEDAEDIVQMAFEKIAAYPERFFEKEVPGRSFLPYLVTTVINLCKDELRRRSRHPTVFYDDPDLTLQEQLRSDHFDIDRCTSLILRQCFARISERDKHILLDHYVLGFTVKELATIYGEHYERLHSRLRRARLALIDAAQEVMNDV